MEFVQFLKHEKKVSLNLCKCSTPEVILNFPSKVD